MFGVVLRRFSGCCSLLVAVLSGLYESGKGRHDLTVRETSCLPRHPTIITRVHGRPDQEITNSDFVKLPVLWDTFVSSRGWRYFITVELEDMLHETTRQ